MMKRIWILCILWPLIASSAQQTSLVRIDLQALTGSEKTKLQAFHIDIASADPAKQSIDALVDSVTLAWLAEKGALAEKIIPDVNAYACELRESGYFEHFRSMPQMVQELHDIVAAHPQIAALYDIGDTYLKLDALGGYDMWALKISDDVAKDDSTEAKVLYMGGLHAREIVTPELIFYFIHYLLDNYGRDALVTHLVQNRELWFIPCANPDGHEYVLQGDPAQRNQYSRTEPLWWRKNMRDNDMSDPFDPLVDGVDLNRNFGFAWGIDNNGSSPHPGSETYRGTAAFSEPESQFIGDFVKSRDFIISLSYHSYGNLWLYPWGYTKEPLPEQDEKIFKVLADSCIRGNGYTPQTGAELYLVNGDTDDWFYGECGIYAFTAEVGHPDFDGFHPDTTRILPLIEENLDANLFVAWAAGEEPLIHCTPLPDEFVQGEDIAIKLEIGYPIVLTDSVALDSSSFRVYYRQEKDFVYSTAPAVFDDSSGLFLSLIPSEKLFGKVYYYAEALDSLSRRGTWPRGAPMAVDSFVVKSTSQTTRQIDLPTSFRVRQNYPNPFNSQTTISFWAAQTTAISAKIFDISGHVVKDFGTMGATAGENKIKWDGKTDHGNPLPSGIYFCKFSAGAAKQTMRLLLLR